MTNRFRNKYRIESSRLQNWDYAWNAAYYVTVCTRNRECYFGEIVKGQMNLSGIGVIADKYWNLIPEHFPFVLLDSYVIMPNHIHGIIIIHKTDSVDNNVETQNLASLRQHHPSKNQFGPQSGNLASIIRGYKTGVKKYSTIHNIDFAWQPRFYDHIIRNDESMTKIRFYIRDNPKRWPEDQLNPDNKKNAT